MLVDSHCHLSYEPLSQDIAGVLDRAQRAGVGHMVNICTRLDQFSAVQSVALAHENVSCSVGIHPHEAEHFPDLGVAALVEVAQSGKVVGIGETGLDYFYDHSPREAQRRSFAVHIEAARQTGLPLIVHCRNAEEDTVAMLSDAVGDGKLKGVIHCFSGSAFLAEHALALGFYVSIAGIVTFKNAEALRQIARDIPGDRLLVETDSPYLAPVPHRGKSNEPAFVAHVADCLAMLRQEDPQALARQTTQNFFKLFDRAVSAAAMPA